MDISQIEQSVVYHPHPALSDHQRIRVLNNLRHLLLRDLDAAHAEDLAEVLLLDQAHVNSLFVEYLLHQHPVVPHQYHVLVVYQVQQHIRPLRLHLPERPVLFLRHLWLLRQ